MKYKIYRDKKGEWRWKAIVKNGRIIADSAEGYKRRYGCHKSLIAFRNMAMYAPIEGV